MATTHNITVEVKQRKGLIRTIALAMLMLLPKRLSAWIISNDRVVRWFVSVDVVNS